MAVAAALMRSRWANTSGLNVHDTLNVRALCLRIDHGRRRRRRWRRWRLLWLVRDEIGVGCLLSLAFLQHAKSICLITPA